jgi:hypothetical protein
MNSLFKGGTMKRGIQIVLIGLLFVVTGCSPKSYWNKPGGTLQEYKIDVTDCKYRVNMDAASGKIPSDRQSRLDEFKKCMESRGYSLIARQYFIAESGPRAKYYHRPDCPFVNDIPSQNQIIIKSAKEARRLWLEPCPHCKPPVDF